MALEFGRVPHPPMEVRQVYKQEGDGWDNLGKRTPRAIVLHRMVGTLRGTDGYFRQAGVGALTDYGVGVGGIDGPALSGVIYRWNDPRGNRSGWANGRVSKPYDDGLKFVNRYGINGVNRDCVSVEISGTFDSALDAEAKRSIAALIAYWADQYRIPHDEFPLIKSEGRNFVIWHQEFTIGTGKICPGPVVMNATDDMISMAKAIMRQHQEVAGGSFVVPRPAPPLSGWNETLGDLTYYAIERKVKAKGSAHCRAWEDEAAPLTRAPLNHGETFRVSWAVKTPDGAWWWVTPYGSRVRMQDTDTSVVFGS